MIINRQRFEFKQMCLIEKITIRASFRFKSEFQHEACFIYFKNAEILISSPTERTEISSHESVLLNCGNHFADFIKNASSETCEVYAVHLYGDLLKEIYKNEIPSFIKQSNLNRYSQKLGAQTLLDHYIDGLIFYFENPKLVTDDLLILKLKELILLLIQTHYSETLIELISKIITTRQANLKEVVRTHLFSNLSVNELATLTARSVSSFKREFQLLFKDSPANYIKEKKLEKEENLLKHSDYSISEICFQIGFKDISHFTRAFRKRNQLTPSVYRKTYQ